VESRGRYVSRPVRTPDTHIFVITRHISRVVSCTACNRRRSEAFKLDIYDTIDDVCAVPHALNTGVAQELDESYEAMGGLVEWKMYGVSITRNWTCTFSAWSMIVSFSDLRR
jgi:hypothetical protein